MRVERLTGSALEGALDDVARLRIAVFRDWPYLYDGDLAYERRYLEAYRNSPRAVVVGALDGARIVGAATGTPMTDHADDFAAAFAGRPEPLDQIFYCANRCCCRAGAGMALATASSMSGSCLLYTSPSPRDS